MKTTERKQEMRRGRNVKKKTRQELVRHHRYWLCLLIFCVGVGIIFIPFVKKIPICLHEVFLSIGSGLVSSVPIVFFIEYINGINQNNQKSNREKDLEYEIYSSMQSVLFTIAKMYQNEATNDHLSIMSILERMKEKKLPNDEELKEKYFKFISFLTERAQYVTNHEYDYSIDIIDAFNCVGEPEPANTSQEIIEHTYKIFSQMFEIKNFSLFKNCEAVFINGKISINVRSLRKKM